MANITLIETHTGSTINNILSAFGPNVSGIYSTLTLKTLQTPVTAFVTSYTFASPSRKDGVFFTFAPSGIATLPAAVTDTGVGMGLSARTGGSGKGPYTGTLNLVLSSHALSGDPGTSFVVDDTTQSISFTLTAVNLPFKNRYSKDRYRRARLGGFI